MQTESGECLIYNSRHSKNYTGGLKQRNLKPKEVKVFPCPERPERCFLSIYKAYSNKRPLSSCYYLKPLNKYSDDKWFQNVPIGHNTLSTLMKTICDAGGLEGNFTNHSLKKTCATALKKFPSATKRMVTGNRSDSILCYEETNDEDFKETSKTLHNIETISKKSVSISCSEVCNEISVQGNTQKKMRIEVDANKNKIVFSFE